METKSRDNPPLRHYILELKLFLHVMQSDCEMMGRACTKTFCAKTTLYKMSLKGTMADLW